MLGLLRRRKPVLLIDIETRHLAGCADIHAEAFSRGWSDGVLHDMLLGKAMGGIVATEGSDQLSQTVLGFILYRSVAGECEIITIATAKDHRRRGVAKSLIDEMIRRCLADRLRNIFLEVDETNLGAIGLYRKFGFKTVGRRKAYYRSVEKNESGSPRAGGLANQPSADHDAVIMRLDLQN